MTSAIVIPARMASTRFPGKPLVDLAGKPMIQWVFEAALKNGFTDRVVVATPDDEIVKACASFGAQTISTSLNHLSGTDRISEVAETLKVDVYINVQGDEPLVDPETIQACAAPLLESDAEAMASVYCPCPEPEYDNPAVVKVVTDLADYALYFSRFCLPYPRNSRSSPPKKHIGIYGYRRKILAEFAHWKPTPLEEAESLEQLRFLENGARVKMSLATASEMAVDTPEQAAQVAQILRGRATSA